MIARFHPDLVLLGLEHTSSGDGKGSLLNLGLELPAVDLDYVAALSSLLDASSAGAGGTTLVVDGIEMKSVAVAPSAIQEVRINNDPYSTEFNRPGRGRIEVTTKPGSQAYYDSIAELYASWGVDFIKADDMGSHLYQPAEIKALALAIRKTGRPMLLSISPGPAPIR